MASVAMETAMLQKELGKTGVMLPEIGLGTSLYAGGVEPLREGISLGASLLDTAEVYGTEELVGQAIRGQRDRVFVATKVLPRNFRRKDLIAAAEKSLQRLGTDYIDLYQLHWPNDTVPVEETMAAMEELVGAGKVRFIGVSNFSIRELKKAQAALSKYRIVSNQVRYSLVHRSIETGLLKYCQLNGITILAFTPLEKGFPKIQACDPEGILARIAASSGKTGPQIALNWVIAKDNVIAIPKSSRVERIIENCGASGWRLSQADYDLMSMKVGFRRRGRIESAARRWTRHMYQSCGKRI